ncbi:acyl carrier protein [Ilyodon furcidens]|uniref:Acyl carrier protein n=1 Tax=Ilyodon furcidens TaxID=33524 RepID=A0ABV0UWJ0_9TELE
MRLQNNMAAAGTKSVVFVCLGNICRSPIAEAVFRKMATDAGVVDKWKIDSAATSTYEIGNPPDHRGQACMKRHGVSMGHVARQVRPLLHVALASAPFLCSVVAVGHRQWRHI